MHRRRAPVRCLWRKLSGTGGAVGAPHMGIVRLRTVAVTTPVGPCRAVSLAWVVTGQMALEALPEVS